MDRRGAAVLALPVLAVLAEAGAASSAWAHAGLISANPAPAATLGAGPTDVQLSFSDRPEPGLSAVIVVGGRGTRLQRVVRSP